jgi:CysZ protein
MPTTAERDGGGSIGILAGAEAFAGGIGFVVLTPRVWGYALVPVTMLLLLACGLSGLGLWGSGQAVRALFGEDPGTWGKVGGWLIWLLMVLVALVLAAVLALSLAQPLSGFALEAIAHAQERALTGHAAPRTSFFACLFSTVRAVVFSLLVGGTMLVVLFVVNFFFPPAVIVTFPLKLLVCGWMLAWDFIDYPLAMRGVGVAERLQWVLRNFAPFTLFGLAWAIIVIVPGVVLLLLPMGVAGATRMVVADDRQNGLLPRWREDYEDYPEVERA